jgi:hypothetical protein
MLGEARQGIEHASRAQAAARAAGYRLLEADALVALGRCHLADGRREEMIRLCRVALDIYRGAGSPLPLATVTALLDEVEGAHEAGAGGVRGTLIQG